MIPIEMVILFLALAIIVSIWVKREDACPGYGDKRGGCNDMSEQTAFPFIRFWKPSNELIPTDLWLMVGDVKVKYGRIFSGFRFEVYESDAEKAKEIVDRVIEQMLADHDEPQHGVSWRTVSLEEKMPNFCDGCYIYEWHYRVRDSY